ncbi:MAG: hypothetical protein RL722_2249 [Pseudomonadota bacterium]|jgi:uncharacterized membrane protein YjgN (DUF898 family)
MNDFEPTHPMPSPGPVNAQDAVPAPAPEAIPVPGAGAGYTRPQRLAIRFTGSGSEYFRIWIVNLLLMLLTLSLYYPYARARKLRYFYGNTWIGEHALSFHGQGRTMLRGYLLVMVLVAAVGGASQVSPAAGLFALSLLGLIWPALFWSSQRFRCHNTRWRGLSPGFTATLGASYARLWPIPVLGVLLLGSESIGGLVSEAGEGADTLVNGLAVVLGLGMFLAVWLVPYGQWRLKHFQHGHYRYASETARLEVGPGAFYKASFQAGLAALGAGAILMVLGLVMALVQSLWLMLGLYLVFLFLIMWVSAYYTASIQNLVWSHTRTRSMLISSELDSARLARIQVRNLLLGLISLGLYWPFAAVHLARVRLEAVSLELAPSFDQLVSAAAERQGDASGDAVAELFGLDAGL